MRGRNVGTSKTNPDRKVHPLKAGRGLSCLVATEELRKQLGCGSSPCSLENPSEGFASGERFHKPMAEGALLENSYPTV